MKQMVKESVIIVLVCAVAYVLFGYAGQLYAQNKTAKAMVASERMNDSVEANTDRTIELPRKNFEARKQVPQVTAEVTGWEYDVINEMYREAMRCRDLNEDFEVAFPVEYAIMQRDGEHHNCIECRLKGIAAAYYDAEWADCFDDCNESDIWYQFEQVLKENKQLDREFRNMVKYVWGE